VKTIILTEVTGQVGSALAPLPQKNEQPMDIFKPATSRLGFDG
jgi:hypothetical protein